MKALVKCKIDSVGSDQGEKGDAVTQLKISTVSANTVELGGKTLPCTLSGTLSLKPIVANRLKIGSILSIEIDVDE